MAIIKTVQSDDLIVRTKAEEVSDIKSEETKRTIEDLVDTMRNDDLVGMAAPQIGVSLRIFVTEIRETGSRKVKDADELRVFINPEIVSTSEEKIIDYEGCGSVERADLFGQVERAVEVTVRAHDENGEEFELTTEGLLARVIQHETDHINGILFTEKIIVGGKTLSREEYLDFCKSK